MLTYQYEPWCGLLDGYAQLLNSHTAHIWKVLYLSVSGGKKLENMLHFYNKINQQIDSFTRSTTHCVGGTCGKTHTSLLIDYVIS